MTAFTGIPIVGQDGSGNNIMLAITSDGKTQSTNNSTSANSNKFWGNTSISALFKSTSNEVVALGTGIDPSGNSVPLIWKRDADGWTNGRFNPGSIRPVGVTKNSTWFFAQGTYIINSSLDNPAPAPAGGLSDTTISSTVVGGYGDGLDTMGSLTVSSSLTTVGSWLSSTGWIHSPGPVTYLPTGHLETTYTFPGYSGLNAQVQYATTVSSGDSYGLMGSPQISVTWPA